MKRQLLLFFFIMCVQVRGETKEEVDLEFAHWLTPKKCFLSDPESLYDKYIDADGGDSEQEHDRFYERYAEVLSKKTDQEHPNAAKFRKPLLEAFKETFEFIRTANGGSGTAHQIGRLPAELERDISQGFENNFDNTFSGEFTLDHIRDLGRIYLQSQAGAADGRDLSALNLDSALGQLETAEKSMSKEEIIYFRVRLLRLIMGYMVR